jgi:capsular polysaccharide export protein
LDNGLIDWDKHLVRAARTAGVCDRIDFLDGGDLDELTRHSAGMVTINSTSSMIALRYLKPLKTMGSSLFDLPGLSWQGSLDTFWSDAGAPSAEDVSDFISVLAQHCHVRGDFYGTEGRRAAAVAFADRLVSRCIWTDLFEPAPPRLPMAEARKLMVSRDYDERSASRG